MKTALIAIGIIVSLALAFVVWRLIATFRATERRNRMMNEKVAPIIEQIESGKEPDSAEMARLAKSLETRRALYEGLKDLGREDLFPKQYLEKHAAAEADIAYWLLHPNELGAVPDVLEFVTILKRKYQNKDLEYYLFRYKMREPHWAAGDGWMIGISGPYLENSPLYSWAPGTFSTFEKYESQTPDEHVDWLHDMMIKKRAYDNLFDEQ